MSMITDVPAKHYFKRYRGDKHFSEFLPTRWRQKSTDIGLDMEQNCVTVTLYIKLFWSFCFQSSRWRLRIRDAHRTLTASVSCD